MKKGGKRVLSLGGKSLKNRKKSKRRTKGGGFDGPFADDAWAAGVTVGYASPANESA